MVHRYTDIVWQGRRLSGCTGRTLERAPSQNFGQPVRLCTFSRAVRALLVCLGWPTVLEPEFPIVIFE